MLNRLKPPCGVACRWKNLRKVWSVEAKKKAMRRGAASWTSKYCWGSAGFKRQGQFSGSKGWSYDRAQRLCKEAS